MSRSRLSSNRGKSNSLILRLIVLGAVLGAGFLVVQRFRHPPSEQPPTIAGLPSLTPSVIPTAIPSAVPLPTNTAYPRANLSAPTVGINADIVDVYLDGQSWDVAQLGNNIGHLQGTGWVGAAGNIGLAGHVELADGRVGVFRNLDKMATGDPITLTLGDLQQYYKVTQVKRANPNDLTILEPSNVDTITLITCDIGAYNLLQNAYLDRVVVVAERVKS
jgi:LPXTG-site transpeptidase (sortase) family protein